eukprot:c20791_g1_i2 orf=202-576(+)
MATTVKSLGLVTNSEQKDDSPHNKKSRHRTSQRWDTSNSKVGPTYPDFKHEIADDSLPLDVWCNPSSFGKELTSRRLALSTRARLDNKVIHDQGTSFVASPQAQAAKRKYKVGRDEATAFVALL